MSDGVAGRELELGLAAIRDVVGAEHVLAGEAEREAHAKDTSLWHRISGAVIYPGTAEDVAEVVKIASRHGLPVWTFSKGKNWGYGAHMGLQEGALVLLLDRMNRGSSRRTRSSATPSSSPA